MKTPHAIAIALTPFIIGACGSPHSGSSISRDVDRPATQLVKAPTAQSVAESIKSAVPEVVELIPITEDNDANNIIGRSNGYVAATVLVDSRVGTRDGQFDEGCAKDKPGIVCGAGIEQWPDEAATQTRLDYLKNVHRSMPFLGSEYETIKGNLLLRVSGKLKPSEAQAYQSIFTR